MLRESIRRFVDRCLAGPRARNLLGKSLAVARSSFDWLHRPAVDPTYDFQNDRSLYPLFAAQLTQIGSELPTHPHYVWGSLQGVSLARALGLERVSVLEFGVAGGQGLLALEKIALKLEQMFGVAIDVYGFDAGSGLPPPKDYRDLPNLWTQGYYPMDRNKLQPHVRKAQLIIGDVKETVSAFRLSNPAPVAFVSFDLDLYSSTTAALSLFEADHSALLPRIHCHFDDILGFTAGEHNGERLAVHEFNQSHAMRKVSHTYGLKYFLPEPFAREMWTEMVFIAHIFDHPRYCDNDGLVRGASSHDPLIERPSWVRAFR